jgi:hypothetical protein
MLVSQTVIPHCRKFRWLYSTQICLFFKDLLTRHDLADPNDLGAPRGPLGQRALPALDTTEDCGKKRTKRRLTRRIEERCWI